MSEPRTGLSAPQVQIVRGEPTDEELAALIAVLAELARAAAAQPPVVHRTRGSPVHRIRTSPHLGPGAWHAALRGHWVPPHPT
ncbi:MAG TPA: acyl-CoA carboxylase subunit epsilon [Pseudonocardiaceae bacterium]|nr:acyl-CoA carboxylase subunit epsilon [Pseudonocardiaceae bacterium]